MATTPASRMAPPRADWVGQRRQNDNMVELAIEPDTLCRIFGVTEPEVASQLLAQVIQVLHPDPSKSVDPATINHALALIEGIGPTNALEAMAVVMLISVNHAASEMMRRAMHPDQSPGGRAVYASLGLKATSTYAKLLEAFHRGRGIGVVERIIVERVTTGPDGQRVVQAVERRRRG